MALSTPLCRKTTVSTLVVTRPLLWHDTLTQSWCDQSSSCIRWKARLSKHIVIQSFIHSFIHSKGVNSHVRGVTVHSSLHVLLQPCAFYLQQYNHASCQEKSATATRLHLSHNIATLLAPQHAQHYSTAVCAVHAQMQQYHKQSYKLKQHFLYICWIS
jgi:hypothetical protein